VRCLTGDAETRVAPLQVRQLTALVQASTGAAPPILRHNATTSGHAGGQPRSQPIDDLVDAMGCLFWPLGVA